jgi:hypothetical protein
MKNISTIILLLISGVAFSQEAKDLEIMTAATDADKVNVYRKYYPNACYVYKTLEDYYKNNPIPNMEWHDWNSGTKVEVVRDGKTEKVRPSDLSDYWYSDQNGLLVRNFLNTLYRVVVEGPICYYVQVGNGEVSKENDSTFTFSPSPGASDKFFEYYSRTIKGDLKSDFDKLLEKYLKEYKLLDQYNAERVERNTEDDVWTVESRRINKKLKYLRIINSRLATK